MVNESELNLPQVAKSTRIFCLTASNSISSLTIFQCPQKHRKMIIKIIRFFTVHGFLKTDKPFLLNWNRN